MCSSRFIHSALALLCGTLLCATTRATEWAANDPRVSYEGRCATGPGNEVRLGFPGVTLRARVHAASLRVRIHASSNDVFFRVGVDGGPLRRVRLQQGDNWLPLFSDLPVADHTVELVRITESWQGVCEIQGLEAANGTLLAPPPLPARKLEFIGDSITCGEGVVPTGDGRTAADRTDATATYAMKLAQRLGAQCELVSYGGRGILRDWQGGRNTNNAPQFYELALPDDPTAKWDPRQYVPDAIGICLGTNDFNQGVPDENDFVNAFVEFIHVLQRDAPNAQIILIDSPILTDGEHAVPKRTVCSAYLDEVVRKVNSPQVRHAAVKHYPGSPGDGHPLAASHTAMADELEPVFRAALGW